jgi:hypothetical protein
MPGRKELLNGNKEAENKVNAI